jgi:hypothetical protein
MDRIERLAGNLLSGLVRSSDSASKKLIILRSSTHDFDNCIEIAKLFVDHFDEWKEKQEKA